MNTINKRYPIIFLIPAAVVYSLFFIFPTLMGFYYSFTDWTVYSDKVAFVGLEQFKNILTDDLFYIGLKNTFTFSVIVTLLQNFIAFIIAIIVNQGLKTKKIIRTIYFMPCILSYLIVGLAFSAILHPEGPLNSMLDSIGLESLAREWLMDPSINIIVIALINVWMFIGFSMAIYLTGLQTIPRELYEASEIDGCSEMQKIRNIIIPLLAPSFTINIIMSLIGSLKVFELVYVTSGGGPGDASQVFNSIIFRAFGKGLYGNATAISLLLFAIICVLSFPILTALRKREVEM